MKKVKSLIVLAFAASLAVFTSCDPTTETTAVGPEIKLVQTATDITLDAGEALVIECLVNEGDAKIEDVVIKQGSGVVYTASDSIDVEDGMQVMYSEVLATAGTYVYTITATDKDGNVETVTINVTVNSVALTDKGTESLGASGATTGSYYSLSTDAVLTSTAAAAAPASVTFLFNYNTTDGAFIASGTEAANTTVKNGATETLFAVADVDFATATLTDITVTPDATKITDLAEGDVIAFKTADGKVGLIKVTAVVLATDGTITLGIKVKE